MDRREALESLTGIVAGFKVTTKDGIPWAYPPIGVQAHGVVGQETFYVLEFHSHDILVPEEDIKRFQREWKEFWQSKGKNELSMPFMWLSGLPNGRDSISKVQNTVNPLVLSYLLTNHNPERGCSKRSRTAIKCLL